jgi:hypothetical protein
MVAGFYIDSYWAAEVNRSRHRQIAAVCIGSVNIQDQFGLQQHPFLQQLGSNVQKIFSGQQKQTASSLAASTMNKTIIEKKRKTTISDQFLNMFTCCKKNLDYVLLSK